MSERFTRRDRPAGSGNNRRPANAAAPSKRSDADHEILFQTYFKSANPRRTYAAQVKRANNKNHYLVLTEGKRDDKTDELRLTRLFLYSEDFPEFFRLMKAAAEFIKANPVPDEVQRRREKFWAKGTPADAAKSRRGDRPAPSGAPRPAVVAAAAK